LSTLASLSESEATVISSGWMDVLASIEVNQPANCHFFEIVWQSLRSYCASDCPSRPPSLSLSHRAPPNANNASKIARTHFHDAKSHRTSSAPPSSAAPPRHPRACTCRGHAIRLAWLPQEQPYPADFAPGVVSASACCLFNI
jgi:hypothetical protein